MFNSGAAVAECVEQVEGPLVQILAPPGQFAASVRAPR